MGTERSKSHSTEIKCGSLVKHCKDGMNAWIEHDDVLSSTVNALVVPDDVDFGNLLYNANCTANYEKLDRYNHDPHALNSLMK